MYWFVFFLQINQVAKKHNINMIFAITESVSRIYKNLVGSIEGSSYGILSGNSSNVVKLVQEQYQVRIISLSLLFVNICKTTESIFYLFFIITNNCTINIIKVYISQQCIISTPTCLDIFMSS
jgi:hypothetical protein